MLDENTIETGLRELQRLNANLEQLHRDAEDFKPLKSDIRLLLSKVGDLQVMAKNAGAAAKQLAILNQILLQIKKVSGWSGVVKSLLDGLVRTVVPPRQR